MNEIEIGQRIRWKSTGSGPMIGTIINKIPKNRPMSQYMPQNTEPRQRHTKKEVSNRERYLVEVSGEPPAYYAISISRSIQVIGQTIGDKIKNDLDLIAEELAKTETCPMKKDWDCVSVGRECIKRWRRYLDQPQEDVCDE